MNVGNQDFSTLGIKGEIEMFKHLQNNYIYVCGGSYNEVEVVERNKDTTVSEKLFNRKNLTCSSNIEIPYYSSGYKNICIYCGGCENLKPISILSFPQCFPCGNKEAVKRSKRKIVDADDLAAKKKK